MGRMGRAEEVAKVLAFMLGDDASYVTGGRSKSPNPYFENNPADGIKHTGLLMGGMQPVAFIKPDERSWLFCLVYSANTLILSQLLKKPALRLMDIWKIGIRF